MIIIEGPNGIRKVPEGEPFILAAGEVVVGSDGTPDQTVDRSLEIMAEITGLQVGDLIEKLTKSLGIPPCPSCEKRKLMLNRIREMVKDLGLKETARRLLETFR